MAADAVYSVPFGFIHMQGIATGPICDLRKGMVYVWPGAVFVREHGKVSPAERQWGGF